MNPRQAIAAAQIAAQIANAAQGPMPLDLQYANQRRNEILNSQQIQMPRNTPPITSY